MLTVSSPSPLQRAAQILRQVGAGLGGARDLEQADGAVGALDAELPVGEFEIGGRGLQQMAGDAQPLLDDDVRGVQHDDAGEPQRAAGMRAAADRDAVGVAGHEPHAVERHAEPFGDSCAKLVSCPWPCDTVPTTTSISPLPSGLTVISARSRGAPVAVST